MSGVSRRRFLQLSAGSPLAQSGAPAAAEEPISIDSGRQLFVDDYLIAETTLHRRFHKPEIDPASPVLKPETPLELNRGVMPAAAPFSDGVWYDPRDRLYKLWYVAGYDDGFALATSEDGIHWQRPGLDVVPGTNCVLAPIPGYERNGSTVWLDHEATDPSERFKMFAYFRRGTGSWPRRDPVPLPADPEQSFLFTSPDGIHWARRVRTGPCGDNSGMFYNPFRKMWTHSIRTSDSRHGRTRSYYEHPHFLTGAQWASPDVKFWAAADALDLPDSALWYRPELYKVDCVAYESRMLGLFAIYFGPPNQIAYSQGYPKTNDLFLAFSRDGLAWDRPDRTAFLRCSRQKGTWNRGYLHSAGGLCLIVGDEIHFYFTAFSGLSPAQGGGPYAGASTGLARLRRDGFASMDAPGIPMPPTTAPPGILTTRPITFSGRYLFVNANVKPGELRVEVLDDDGRTIEPFTLANSVPLTADATKQAVLWKGAADLRPLAGKPICFRFQVTAGELYAFWVSRDVSGASHGYVAAGGPGFTGATDTTGA
ncbi:MAG: glycosyl hydrolase family 32 [Bryobacteraceae bacterium]